MKVFEQELEYMRNFEMMFLTKLEGNLKFLDEGYYVKLMECKTEDLVLQNKILRELSEYENKPSNERLKEVADLYNYIKRSIVVREEYTDEIARLRNELELLKQY